MRLHIRMLGAEKMLGAFDRQALDAIDILAATVVALARIAFRVFIREDLAHRFQHRFGNEIFRRDQFQAGRLPPHFFAQRLSDLRIDFVQRAAHA